MPALLAIAWRCRWWVVGALTAFLLLPLTARAEGTSSLATLNDHAQQALTLLEHGDVAGSRLQWQSAAQSWPAIEASVEEQWPGAYHPIDAAIDDVSAAYAATPFEVERTEAALEHLVTLDRQALTDADTPTQYSPWDAALILLREGLEAILVITALLAFLKKSGNAARSGWVWAGGGAGILASVIVGVLIQASFARAVSGAGREWVEGLTGLLAAVMLVYMSWWLHGKASLAAWRAYITQHTSRALATGSLLSLAALAFLAVFREGAETMLFFVGIAPGITLPNLLLGLGLGAAALLAIAVAILGFGLRLPLRPFFFGASLLVYYLAFKFLGTGLHALQEAGIVPVTPTPRFPAIDWLGVFPSWQTTVPQLLLLLLAALVICWPRLHPQARLAGGH